MSDDMQHSRWQRKKDARLERVSQMYVAPNHIIPV